MSGLDGVYLYAGPPVEPYRLPDPPSVPTTNPLAVPPVLVDPARALGGEPPAPRRANRDVYERLDRIEAAQARIEKLLADVCERLAVREALDELLKKLGAQR